MLRLPARLLENERGIRWEALEDKIDPMPGDVLCVSNDPSHVISSN